MNSYGLRTKTSVLVNFLALQKGRDAGITVAKLASLYFALPALHVLTSAATIHYAKRVSKKKIIITGIRFFR